MASFDADDEESIAAQLGKTCVYSRKPHPMKLTGERFEADGTSTCFDAMDWELTPELHDYFLQRDFSAPPSLP